MANQKRTISQLRNQMQDKLEEAFKGTIDIKELEQFTNLYGKIIKSAEVELKAATIVHNIGFLKSDSSD